MRCRVAAIEALGLCLRTVATAYRINRGSIGELSKEDDHDGAGSWPSEVRLGARRAGQVARRATTICRSASLREAAARLAADRAGVAVVEDAGRPIEVMSLQDLAVSFAAGADLDDRQWVTFALSGAPIFKAAPADPNAGRDGRRCCERGLVLDEDGLVGLVTLADLWDSLVSPTVETCTGDTPDPLSRWLQVKPSAACDLNPDMEIWVRHDHDETTINVRGRLDETTAGSLARARSMTCQPATAGRFALIFADSIAGRVRASLGFTNC